MNGIIGFDGTLEGSVNAGGGGGTVPEIYADATVDNNTGTPAVTVTRTEIPGVSDTFHFAFQNLKGETGSAGSQGIQGIQGIPGPEGPQGPRGFTGQTGSAGPAGSDGYSPVVTIAAITGGNRVTITDETHPLGQSFDVMNGIDGSDGQTGPQGPQGNPGQGVPTGGTDGQILAKNGSSDYQTRWIDPIPDALPIISDEYDEHTAYSVGNYCINENTLYKCNTDINPYEVWDPSHWDACTVGEEIAAANSEIDTINASLTQLINNLDFDNEEVIDLTVSNPQYTPTTAGIITGYFRKDTTSANGVAGVTSSKVGNAYRYIQTIAGGLSGGYAPINMVVVKGEVLKFASLTAINTSSGQTRISFIPFKINT